MKKFSLLSILLAVALVCSAQKPVAAVSIVNAPESVELRLNLPKDKTFEQNTEMKMKMKMDIMGMKIDTEVPFSSKISYKVVDIQNGNFVLECAFEKMKMSMDILGQKMSFDSSDKNQDFEKNPMAKTFSAFIGKKFIMILDKFQNVVAVEGFDRLFDSMFGDNDEQSAQMAAMLQGMLGEDKIKENFSSSNIIFPKEPVNEGFTWETEMSQNLQGMNMQVKNQFKVEKITAKHVEISSVSYYSMDFSMSEGEQNVNIKMQDAKATGTYVIDLHTGWTISAKTNADMNMVMTTNQGGMEMEIPMQLIMKIIVN